MSARGRYDQLSAAELRAVLERRDREARYGLVWEREGIAPDRAINDDFVALDLVPELCVGAPDEAGWSNLVVEGVTGTRCAPSGRGCAAGWAAS